MSDKYANVKKLAKALDDLKEIGEDVASDGKVDLSDATQLPRLVGPVQDIVDVYGSKDQLVGELVAFLDEKLQELLA